MQPAKVKRRWANVNKIATFIFKTHNLPSPCSPAPLHALTPKVCAHTPPHAVAPPCRCTPLSAPPLTRLGNTLDSPFVYFNFLFRLRFRFYVKERSLCIFCSFSALPPFCSVPLGQHLPPAVGNPLTNSLSLALPLSLSFVFSLSVGVSSICRLACCSIGLALDRSVTQLMWLCVNVDAPQCSSVLRCGVACTVLFCVVAGQCC